MCLYLCRCKIQLYMILLYKVKLSKSRVKTKSIKITSMIIFIIYTRNPMSVKKTVLFIYVKGFREAGRQNEITNFYNL